MKLSRLFIVGSLALTMVSCGTKVKPAEVVEEQWTFPSKTVEEGFALQAEHCVRCHKLKTVKDYTREQWDKILPNMAKKAKLTAEQEATLNEYINWELNR